MAQSRIVKHQVAVHKSLPLAAGESVGKFTRQLADAGRAHLEQALNLVKKTSSVYLTETMSGVAVFDVYKQAEDGYKYYALKFKRDKAGTFEFGSMTEVERVTSFREKKTMLQKSLVAESTRDEAWIEKSIAGNSLFAGVL